MPATSRLNASSYAIPFQSAGRRSLWKSQWGILFAILAILVTTLLSWQELAAQQSIHPSLLESSTLPSAPSLLASTQDKVAEATEIQSLVTPLDFEDIDFNRGWRKGKSGWVQIQKYNVGPSVDLNFVQKLSPIFWAVTLWMFAIVLLVLAS